VSATRAGHCLRHVPGTPVAPRFGRRCAMAGKNRKGGSSGSQQTGQGNQQGGQKKGKSSK
jgi:hypothetical protein